MFMAWFPLTSRMPDAEHQGYLIGTSHINFVRNSSKCLNLSTICSDSVTPIQNQILITF